MKFASIAAAFAFAHVALAVPASFASSSAVPSSSAVATPSSSSIPGSRAHHDDARAGIAFSTGVVEKRGFFVPGASGSVVPSASASASASAHKHHWPIVRHGTDADHLPVNAPPADTPAPTGELRGRAVATGTPF